ncbi:hypothetical protein K1T71_005662 [Dendrolimus kikuchii]|uniref:Uncharacterized protein n=1 Tax=Dendrolimus kikuchii TaxID=765133 RepID=A0ACC1D5T8_9NEOP|nr:hypothetical protein K1T71_005662 [Dendrolimus kikuchii]
METNANQKVSCVVNYAYDASESDELTIRPGDVLRDVERLPGGWWRGELRGRRGMFPDNFVSVLTERTNNRSTGVQGRCRAVFSYQPANPDELPLCVGDVLEVLGEVEEGWWQGRRLGRVGVFPSNFVVMLDPPQTAPPPYEPAPALPPKPVKEQCRVLFPYEAVNEDELTLVVGDIVTIISKDAPDRGWWRGEVHGAVGLFPDNFVELLPNVAPEVEEKKPERPPSKGASTSIYPILNKYSEKTASVKELTTSKISLHKENTLSKETSTQSTVTHTNKNESEKIIHSETVTDGTLDGQVKKPPVPLKKSPTPTGVGGLFSGLKNKMLSSSDKEKSSSTTASSSSSSAEGDRVDGAALAKPAANNASTNSTGFDHIERNSILNDPRANRVKAPRRRPPSQALRDDTPQQIGLSNGHEGPPPPLPLEKPPIEKGDEIKPRAREWEKHRAPWMEELKLNQAKKGAGEGAKARAVSAPAPAPDAGLASKVGGGSTDRILDCGLDEKRATHSMEMSKSTSSISSRMTILDNFEETTTKLRHSLDSKKEATPLNQEPELPTTKPPVQSPTAADTLVSDNKHSTGIFSLTNKKLLEEQTSMFKTAISSLESKLKIESEKRQALQTEMEKLAQCVTQV